MTRPAQHITDLTLTELQVVIPAETTVIIRDTMVLTEDQLTLGIVLTRGTMARR